MSESIPSKQAFYIFSNGTLKRKDNTIFFLPAQDQTEKTIENAPPVERDEEEISLELDVEELPNHPNRKALPIANIDAFYVFGEVSFNARFLNFLAQHKIPMHIFNHYGFYSGTYYPREYLVSGMLLVSQVQHYTSEKKRLKIAREIVSAACFNITKNLRYYSVESRAESKEVQEALQAAITEIEEWMKEIPAAGDIQTLMGIEGNVRKRYYDAWQYLIKSKEPAFQFRERVKDPPNNAINALISFGNALCYSACLTEIYRTQLSPTISYLHEPSERRFSLALDLAEIFKPIFVDRAIFKLVNTREIQEKHFTNGLNSRT
ncbi:MAG: type I-B CRISPR-associated endonuclease Cas1b [Chloroherpetonaceae bacterium]|nr:type I-B CRISPR-associated endonuclease Cas1b [Chloroherpetonaceae bacterium]